MKMSLLSRTRKCLNGWIILILMIFWCLFFFLPKYMIIRELEVWTLKQDVPMYRAFLPVFLELKLLFREGHFHRKYFLTWNLSLFYWYASLAPCNESSSMLHYYEAENNVHVSINHSASRMSSMDLIVNCFSSLHELFIPIVTWVKRQVSEI